MPSRLKMTALTPEELARRRPVWQAMSDMFLDTDTSQWRASRARVLSASGYSESELDRILLDEVCPVCGANLMSAAGEWAGFDPVWLEQAIVRQKASLIASFGRMLPSQAADMIADEWEATKKVMAETQ